MIQKLSMLGFVIVFTSLATGPVAHAVDDSAATPQPTPSASPSVHKKHTKKKKKKVDADLPPAEVDRSGNQEHQLPSAPGQGTDTPDKKAIIPGGAGTATASEETQNNRMKTLEGSKSPFSLQLNLSYSGSSIDNPFSANPPNPGHQVPPPIAQASGILSGRYRIDKDTTVGVGIGITTQTPFQGPKNTTLSDPNADIAHSFNIGPIHNRSDFQATIWTDQQLHSQYGYVFGLTALNEGYYAFNFGLTVGFLVEIDYNFFNSSFYDKDGVQDAYSNQTEWDLATDPYFEFQLSKKVNLRSVVGIVGNHNNDLNNNFFSLNHPHTYETFGVGVSIFDSWFIYPFVSFYPLTYQWDTSKKMLFGFNTIINLF